MGTQRKYELWKDVFRNTELGGRLLTTAVNLAEDRRGFLLVVLDDPEMAATLSRELICLRHFQIMPNTRSQEQKTQHHASGAVTNLLEVLRETSCEHPHEE